MFVKKIAFSVCALMVAACSAQVEPSASNASELAVAADVNICLRPYLTTSNATIKTALGSLLEGLDCPKEGDGKLTICVPLASKSSIDDGNKQFAEEFQKKCPGQTAPSPFTNQCSCSCKKYSAEGIACKDGDLSQWKVKTAVTVAQ